MKKNIVAISFPLLIFISSMIISELVYEFNPTFQLLYTSVIYFISHFKVIQYFSSIKKQYL